MKIRPVEAELFREDGRTDKQIRSYSLVAFHNSANAPKWFLFPHKLSIGRVKFRQPLPTCISRHKIPSLSPCPDRTMLPTEPAIYVARAFLWSPVTNRRLCPNFHHRPHKYFSVVGTGNRLQGVCVVASHDGSDVIFLNIRSSEGVQ
jgi:hypothetical protein